MFSWLATRFVCKTPPVTVPQARIALEHLESRDLPSATSVLASLQDPSLQAAAQVDYLRDGKLTRTDMIALFQGVAQDGQVTPAELADLNTLVNHGSDLGMPLYVQELSAKVVGFDLANEQFLGHVLFRKGQLTAGATGTQLDDLVDKWFLGQDLPTAKNDAGTLFSYQLASGSLFGSGGPSYRDIDQGDLGDCYYLASLGEIVTHDAQAIKDLFLDNGDGTFTVRFFHQVGSQQVQDFVTVNLQLPVDNEGQFVFANMGQSASDPSNVLWVALAEKAYAQLAASGWSRADFGAFPANSYRSISGGLGAAPMQQMLGESTQTYGLFSSTATTLVADLQAGDLITLGSRRRELPQSHVIGNHEYYVTAYNSSTKTFTVVNPWGANLATIGTLHLTEAQVLKYYNEFDGAGPAVPSVSWH